MNNNRNKLRDAIYGLAVGDALGVPVEFKKRGTFLLTDMVGYGTYNQPPGTWSDDTSLTLATCASIKKKSKVDCKDLYKEFCKWLFDGKYAIDGNVFDVGNTTSDALNNGKGIDGFHANGNGSLMRILPLAFMDVDIETICDVSAITHANVISKDICCQYVWIAKQLLSGKTILDIIENYPGDLSNIINMNEDEINSTGFVIDTFEAAIWCLVTSNNYKDTVLKAVNLGGDTDTIAAVAGGLAGIIYGLKGIPEKWIEKLKGKDIIEECLF